MRLTLQSESVSLLSVASLGETDKSSRHLPLEPIPAREEGGVRSSVTSRNSESS